VRPSRLHRAGETPAPQLIFGHLLRQTKSAVLASDNLLCCGNVTTYQQCLRKGNGLHNTSTPSGTNGLKAGSASCTRWRSIRTIAPKNAAIATDATASKAMKTATIFRARISPISASSGGHSGIETGAQLVFRWLVLLRRVGTRFHLAGGLARRRIHAESTVVGTAGKPAG